MRTKELRETATQSLRFLESKRDNAAGLESLKNDFLHQATSI